MISISRCADEGPDILALTLAQEVNRPKVKAEMHCVSGANDRDAIQYL